MEACSDYIVLCSVYPEDPVVVMEDDCHVPAVLPFLYADDCACPADGLRLPATALVEDEALLLAVRMFLAPVDDEYAVGYSPFVWAGRSC